MAPSSVVRRWLHHNDLRVYRRTIAAEIQRSLALQVLPALADLPLALGEAAAAPTPWPTIGPEALATQIQTRRFVTLAGAPGSGRRLALQQAALYWANTGDDTPLPLVIALPRLDDGRSPPRALLGRWVAYASATVVRQSLLPRPAPLLPGLTDQLGGWALLFCGWEELPLARRSAWRAALLDAPELWPVATLAVALPEDEPAWPGFSALAISAPDQPLLERWVTQLAPNERQADLLAALAPAGQLAALAGRLSDVALLAWLAPHHDLPTNRAELYEQAMGQLLRRAPGPELGALQRMVATGELPAGATSPLLESTALDRPRFIHTLARSYLLARQVASERGYDRLRRLAPLERAEVARLLAVIVREPTALFAALWRAEPPETGDLLALAASIAEAPQRHPEWAARVLAALASLEQREPASAVQARQLVRQLATAIDTLVEQSAPTVTARLIEQLPAELALPRAVQLAFAETTSTPLAWQLADQLANGAFGAFELPDPPASPAALARWGYVAALADAATRVCLAVRPELLESLDQTELGAERMLRMASALLADLALPARVRAALLARLNDDDTPAVQVLAEQAAADALAEVREAGLHLRQSQAASRARVALERDLANPQANPAARLHALLLLCGRPDAWASLARAAADESLPLYARLRLASAAPGPLAGVIVRAGRCHPLVRAAAAERIGALGERRMAGVLLAILDDQAAPVALLAGAINGLTALRPAGALARIQALLARCGAEVELTQVALHALGQLRDLAALDTLASVLGAGALERLCQAVGRYDPQQAAETSLEAQVLPPPLALRLAAALAGSALTADRPTTLGEFLAREADLLRRAAAQALAALGGTAASQVLQAALPQAGGATRDILLALEYLAGPAAPAVLAELVGVTAIGANARWLAVERLSQRNDAASTIRQLIEAPLIDPFARGALAEALGRQPAPGALVVLSRLATDTATDLHVRAQAVLGLGHLGDPTAEPALLRIIASADEPAELRGLAAEHLPHRLSAVARDALYELLDRERAPLPLLAGALRALGNAADRQSLALLLRHAQDERPRVALAALLALGQLNDPVITPVLVRLTQNPHLDRPVRIVAAGVLLRLGGSEYRPILRTYLESGPLPQRLQALDLLVAVATPAELCSMLASRSWPLAFRLRLFEACANHPEAAVVLRGIAADTNDDTEVRVRAISRLAVLPDTSTVETLVPVAQTGPDLTLRLAAISALGSLGGQVAALTLSRLAEDTAQPPVVYGRVITALRALVAAEPVEVTQ